MKLLDLPTGRVSLELTSTEVEAVLRDLEDRGGFSRESHATHDMLSSRGESFVFLNEWKDPCLISTGPAGDSLLRDIAGADRPRVSAA